MVERWISPERKCFHAYQVCISVIFVYLQYADDYDIEMCISEVEEEEEEEEEEDPNNNNKPKHKTLNITKNMYVFYHNVDNY